MNEINKKRNKNDGGFIILFAVTLSAILLSVALGVSNISFQEASFSTSARDSNDAFLAADTGVECALFHDKLTGSSFPLDGVGRPANISCAGQTWELDYIGTPPDVGVYNFVVSGLGSSGGSCARVEIRKDQSTTPVNVVVTANGYNVGDGNCDSTSNRRVERELVVSSRVGSTPLYTPPSSTVDLKCNGADSCSIAYNSSPLLSWTTSASITSCTAVTNGAWTGSKSLPTGNQTISNLTSTQTYTINCSGESGAVSDSVTVTVLAAAPVCDTSFPNDALRACYFDGTSAPTTAVAYLSQFTESTLTSPVGSWSGFTHDWGGGLVDSSGKSDSVSAVWRGNINFQSGNYVFHVVADDGVQLTVDGVNVINNAWVDQGATQYNSASVSLSGYKNVQMRWYENGGGAYSRLWWDYTPASCSITGGTITTVSGYRIHTFYTPDNFIVGCAKTVDYLIVGGGGSGASVTDQTGGGGGGGEVVSGTTALSSGSTFPITNIGNGGTNGGSGGNTVAGGLTVRGGGGGGCCGNPTAASGGSGAGAKSGHFGPYTGGSSTSVSPGIGFAGGSGNDYGAGGGGGATAVGQTAWNNGTWHGGNGGAGYASSISGVATYYGAGGGGAGGNTYNGGGDGVGGSGGSGVGGAGANFTADPSCYRASGGAATGFGNGGGGAAHIGSYGGGCDNDVLTGGAGSPGVVIIRYAYP